MGLYRKPGSRDEGAAVGMDATAPDRGADGDERGLATPASVGALMPLAQLGEQARAYAEAGHADNTRRAYRNDWRAFTAWCAARELAPLPAASATLALYLTDQADALKVSTLQRRLVAIAQAHRLAGHASPTEDVAVKAV